MTKHCIFLLLVMIFSPGAYSANTYAYLWKTNNNASGGFSYTGPSLATISGAMSSLYTGTMSISYATCSTTEHEYVFYQGVDRWIFIPSSIIINGINVPLSVNAPHGYYLAGQLPSGEYVYKSYVVTNVSMEGKCSDVGHMYPINYTYPEISLTADVSGLVSGAYAGTIPIKMAFAEYFTINSGSEISRFSDDLAYNNTSVVQLPFNINITNTCQLSPLNITIDHGKFNIGQGNGNTVKKDLAVTCDGPTSLTIDFKPLTAPTKSYSDGVGVGLGHGVDAVVQIGDFGLSNASTAKTIQVEKGVTTMTLTSTIHENDNSSVGNLSGSANLNLTIK